jgi:hypothetical protein
VKRSPLKTIVVSCEPWNWTMLVVLGGTHADLVRYVKKLGIDADVNDQSIGHTFVHAGKPVVVWCQTCDIVVLVHELIHGVFGMLEGRGVKHCDASPKWKGAKR